MTNDHCYHQNFFRGLSVKIKTSNHTQVEGKVKNILTKISYDPWGIYVELETGEFGNTVQIIQTDNEKIYNQLISDFIFNLEHDESPEVEFKETFAYPVDPEIPLSDVTSQNKNQIRFYTAKSIAAFANASGGTLYIGIQNRTKNIMGLERDFKLLDEGEQDSDGLGKIMKSYLASLFGRGNRLFDVAFITFIKHAGKDICVVKVKQSKFALVLTFEGKNHYFVRQNDSSNRHMDNKGNPDLNSFLDYWTEHIQDN